MTTLPEPAVSDPTVLLDVALDEARAGLAEGGIPIGAALFAADGTLLGRGHNRRVQDDDPSMHAETAAFRAAGRQRDYRSTIMVTTLVAVLVLLGAGAPVRHRRGADRRGAARSTAGTTGSPSTASTITVLDDDRCVELMTDFIAARPELWHEDIGEPS